MALEGALEDQLLSHCYVLEGWRQGLDGIGAVLRDRGRKFGLCSADGNRGRSLKPRLGFGWGFFFSVGKMLGPLDPALRLLAPLH